MTKPVVTVPLTAQELDELEKLLREFEDVSRNPAMGHEAVSVCASRLRYALVDHTGTLLASARQLLELTEALDWLADRGWWSVARQRPNEIVAYAKSLGWQPRKDGGNG
jgi:hypothetical protein